MVQERHSAWHKTSWRRNCTGCAGCSPLPVDSTPSGLGPAVAAPRQGGSLLHPLLPAAVHHLQADSGHAADPRSERAGARWAEGAAERGQQPVGPSHADAALQHTIHALHLLPHRHAPHTGMPASPRLVLLWPLRKCTCSRRHGIFKLLLVSGMCLTVAELSSMADGL